MDVIDTIESSHHTHFVLFNENQSIVNKIELQFIQNGLEKNEMCLFATNDVPTVIHEMEKFGIDVTKYKEKHLLEIIEIPKDFDDYKKIVLEKLNELDKLTQQIRLVSTHNFDFSKIENTKDMVYIEQCVDDDFSKIHGNMICSFYGSAVTGNNAQEFMTKLLDSHHGVIFLKKDGTEKIFSLP